MAKRLGFTKREIKQLNVMIGINLKAARDNAGMTMSDVMKAVWGVGNNRNRIGEIETGRKNITVAELMIFQELYGQSLDYICGLSCEPELDMLAGTVNHVVNQSHSIIETAATEFASVLVTHMKSICKNDHEALLDCAKTLCSAVKLEYTDKEVSPKVGFATNDMMRIIRSIEIKQARQAVAVEMQMTQITERANKLDRQNLWRDRNKHYQYSMPLTKPQFIDDGICVTDPDEAFVGVGND